ncbi:TIGR03986 family CRISPR-associated RAMP protein [Plantactinospora sp. KBS50]|uniref:TIGR03986 family type III CRISPR-associated RAMP protein n=1 Tax=Plantactinospora sp. KBS50 TaxID=2024580 RepID=UPI001E3349EB|nr:TIGR03986 family CRISPR-associated RAMP protein [Plantactinospora sp. KBS50]
MTDQQGLCITVETKMVKRGDALEGVIPISARAKDARPKQLHRREWDVALAEHVTTMAEGDSVAVEVTIDRRTGIRDARLHGVAALPRITPDPERATAVAKNGGTVNPYTFVPTPPRIGLDRTGMADGAPASHAYHTAGQWSGTLALTLTTVTPLLLPVLAADQPKDGPRAFEVRVDPTGMPLIHGASLKGALRSPYETITASRYGVFFGHHKRLAYRVPANTALDLTPARVCEQEDGRKVFRICRGDVDWIEPSEPNNQVQCAAWVPAYGAPPVRRLGGLDAQPLTAHHRTRVHARVVLYQYERTRGRTTRFQVWRATHLARSKAEIETSLRVTRHVDVESAGSLTRVSAVAPRVVQGWLSATGRTIGSKHDERLFIESPQLTDVPVEGGHEEYWQAVLSAYDQAQDYNDPNATQSRTRLGGTNKLTRSPHVGNKELYELPVGTLVYVKYDRGEVSQVHPVMIGRLPFDSSPGELLPESLRPAPVRDQLSSADRLFGWVPSHDDDGNEDDDGANDGASGYRGRLQVHSIICTTKDWGPPGSFPKDGVTLAPLSSPKPTQFRFYASPDREGSPMPRKAAKATGYAAGSGLRGRKMYRWREETPSTGSRFPTAKTRHGRTSRWRTSGRSPRSSPGTAAGYAPA